MKVGRMGCSFQAEVTDCIKGKTAWCISGMTKVQYRWLKRLCLWDNTYQTMRDLTIISPFFYSLPSLPLFLLLTQASLFMLCLVLLLLCYYFCSLFSLFLQKTITSTPLMVMMVSLFLPSITSPSFQNWLEDYLMSCYYGEIFN